MLKTCSRCFEEFPSAYFNKDRSTTDGFYPRCKICSRKACRASYRKHEVDHRALKQRWKDENRDRHHEINRAYQLAYPERVREGAANYRARLKRATPPWMCKELLDLVRSECPSGWHVDHIWPLAGENFCGLNVPWNLQFLPPEEHWKKGTKPPVAQEAAYNL